MTQINRAYFTISNTPGAAGSLTVGPAMAGAYRTLGAAHDGMSLDVSIVDGSAWEIRTGCVYTHATTSLSRGTLEDSSTGSAITLSASANVMVTGVASTANSLALQLSRGYTDIRTSVSQSCPNNTVTALGPALNVVSANAKNWWNTTTRRFQPNQPGLYEMTARVQFQPAAISTGKLNVGFRFNGVGFDSPAEFFFSSTTIDPTAWSSVIYSFNGTTDFVEIACYHNLGGTQNTYAVDPTMVRFTGYYLGPT